MLNNILNQSFYRIKKKEVLEESQEINVNNVFNAVKDYANLLSELLVISSYDDSASLLHKSFMENEDSKLLNRVLVVSSYLKNPTDKDVIKYLVEEIEKAQANNISEKVDDLETDTNKNYYTKIYEEKRKEVERKMDSAKLIFYAHLHDVSNFYSKLRELEKMAKEIDKFDDFDIDVLENTKVKEVMIQLSLLMFVANPKEESVNLILDNLKEQLSKTNEEPRLIK